MSWLPCNLGWCSRRAGAMARRLHMPRSAVLLLFVFLSGCSASTRSVVRLDTGQGEPLVHTPRRDVEPVEVSEKEFKKAVAQHAPSVPAVERPLEYARRLFGVPERSGWYRYEGRSQRLMASAAGEHPEPAPVARGRGAEAPLPAVVRADVGRRGLPAPAGGQALPGWGCQVRAGHGDCSQQGAGGHEGGTRPDGEPPGGGGHSGGRPDHVRHFARAARAGEQGRGRAADAGGHGLPGLGHGVAAH